MKNLFAQTSFTVETTKDGSPTLRLPDSGESMHHGAGAAGETRYIYKAVLDAAHDILPEATTGIVGLGLGYIELCWALNAATAAPRLTSFEIDPDLRRLFLEWLDGVPAGGVYQDVCASLKIPESEIHLLRGKLRQNYRENPICPDLRGFRHPELRWNVVCYDAFSSRTNQDLWTYEFLDTLIKNQMAEDCAFTTYACTGVLKKVMADNGFLFIKRPGFEGKRDSSLALRGRFTEYERSFCRTF